MHVILSIVLQAFRFTHETLAEDSYGNATAYTGKLHSLLCTTYVANTEPHLRLLDSRESFVLVRPSKIHCHSRSSTTASCPLPVMMYVERCGLDVFKFNSRGFTLEILLNLLLWPPCLYIRTSHRLNAYKSALCMQRVKYILSWTLSAVEVMYSHFIPWHFPAVLLWCYLWNVLFF